MIAILVPTKGRPEQCKRMLQSVKATISSQVDVFLGLSTDDAKVYGEYVGADVIFPEWMPTVHKWNMLARKAMEHMDINLFMLGSDDIMFETPMWDVALVRHYSRLKNKAHCYHLQDSRDHDGTPHIIVTREWIETMGYFLIPIFNHWHADTWTREIAKANCCFTHLRDYNLRHIKPSDEGKPDSTHTGIRSQGWAERDEHVNKTCKHFMEWETRRLALALQ